MDERPELLSSSSAGASSFAENHGLAVVKIHDEALAALAYADHVLVAHLDVVSVFHVDHAVCKEGERRLGKVQRFRVVLFDLGEPALAADHDDQRDGHIQNDEAENEIARVESAVHKRKEKRKGDRPEDEHRQHPLEAQRRIIDKRPVVVLADLARDAELLDVRPALRLRLLLGNAFFRSASRIYASMSSSLLRRRRRRFQLFRVFDFLLAILTNFLIFAAIGESRLPPCSSRQRHKSCVKKYFSHEPPVPAQVSACAPFPFYSVI